MQFPWRAISLIGVLAITACAPYDSQPNQGPRESEPPCMLKRIPSQNEDFQSRSVNLTASVRGTDIVIRNLSTQDVIGVKLEVFPTGDNNFRCYIKDQALPKLKTVAFSIGDCMIPGKGSCPVLRQDGGAWLRVEGIHRNDDVVFWAGPIEK